MPISSNAQVRYPYCVTMGAASVAEHATVSGAPSYLTRFVGRAGYLDDLQRWVVTASQATTAGSMLSLVGLGGSGKTRLVVELAARLAADEELTGRFAGGGWWVDLTALTTVDQLWTAVGRAARLIGSDADSLSSGVSRVVRQRGALLLLDNCEHLAAACQELGASLLPSCPGLVVLATSRTPLGIGTEIYLDALGGSAPGAIASRGEAAELFFDRAGLVFPGYSPTVSEEQAVAAVCQRLGGMPLAIELAAPWLRTLSAPDLLARIEHGLDLVATSSSHLPARHRALRLVLDNTWSSLSTREQETLRAMGVFVGECSLAAAERVAGADLTTLATLTGRSLIRRLPLDSDDTRFVMHEVVRQYALDRLDEQPADAVTRVRLRHVEHLIEETRRFEEARRGPHVDIWLARLQGEEADVEAALAWASEHGASEALLRLTAGMKNVWAHAGSLGRHHAAITAALGQPWDPTSAAAGSARAVLTLAAGWSELSSGSIDRARSSFVESLALNQQFGDPEQQAVRLRALSRVALDEGEHATAERLARQSLRICCRAGDEVGASWSMMRLAEAARGSGDSAAAERHLLDSIAGFHRLDVGLGEAGALGALADLQRRQHRWLEALDGYRRSLDTARRSGTTAGTHHLVSGVATLAADLGRPRSAAQLLGTADSWAQTYGSWEETMSPLPDAGRAGLHAVLGEDAWTAAYDAGVQLDPGQALATATQVVAELGSALAAPLPSGLTSREVQVLGLLAQGLSNAELATRLVVSPRTIHAHLRSVFGKLGVSTRTAAVHEAGRLGVRL